MTSLARESLLFQPPYANSRESGPRIYLTGNAATNLLHSGISTAYTVSQSGFRYRQRVCPYPIPVSLPTNRYYNTAVILKIVYTLKPEYNPFQTIILRYHFFFKNTNNLFSYYFIKAQINDIVSQIKFSFPKIMSLFII